MNIIGIDYGKKRIGLAWVQEGLDVVLPYGIVGNVEELIKLVKKEKIDKLVIGLPIGLDGRQENENTQRVREFAEKLKKEIDLPIEFVDERFSSAEADSMGGEVSRDEKAAMVILQSYLDKK